jgi:hypothetical protein
LSQPFIINIPTPIYFGADWSVVFMPEESPVAIGDLFAFETRFASGALGVLADEIEFLLLLFPFDLSGGEFVVAGADAALTGASCIANGECYFGKPHPDLPEMLVVNQDVLVNAGDFAVSWTVVLDIITTSVSFIYDTIDIGGGVPNMVSIGVAPNIGWWQRQWKIYILIYPDGGTEWDPSGWN